MFVYHRVRAGTACHSLQARARQHSPGLSGLKQGIKVLIWSEIEKKLPFCSKIEYGIQEAHCTTIFLGV